MEAGERYPKGDVYRTPISIFEVIRLGRLAPPIMEEKDPENSIPSAAKEKELPMEFCFPNDIF